MKYQKNLPKASIRDQETDFMLWSLTEVSYECQKKVEVLQSIKVSPEMLKTRFLYKFNPEVKGS